MMSPNGSVPPIYVPPGYAPQVCFSLARSLSFSPLLFKFIKVNLLNISVDKLCNVFLGKIF